MNLILDINEGLDPKYWLGEVGKVHQRNQVRDFLLLIKSKRSGGSQRMEYREDSCHNIGVVHDSAHDDVTWCITFTQ